MLDSNQWPDSLWLTLIPWALVAAIVGGLYALYRWLA